MLKQHLTACAKPITGKVAMAGCRSMNMQQPVVAKQANTIKARKWYVMETKPTPTVCDGS